MKIELRELTKRFPGRVKNSPPVTAVDHFTLELPDGELSALLGPSGCGKSTVLNLISGLLAPTEGRIFFGEDDVTELPPENRGVGLVFQSYALYPHMTVLQNILFPLENLRGADRLSREEMLRRAHEAAELVQIGQLLDRRPKELSGGQQQRVAIARALVKHPRVLLLDEPLSNLDARLRLQTREELRRIQQESGVTTVFVTHDQEEAMSISDRIIVMNAGAIHQTGRPQEVYDSPADLFVAKFLGTPAINIFHGRVESGRLFLGGDDVLNVPGISDRSVTVGIRPEGFEPDPAGPLRCRLLRREVMGRDASVIFSHPAAESDPVRAILDSGDVIDTASPELRLSLRPRKVHLFDPETGERLPFSGV